MIDDLARRLSGCRVGQLLAIDATGPDAHELEALRGKKLVLSVRITSAQRIEPALKASPDAASLEPGS